MTGAFPRLELRALQALHAHFSHCPIALVVVNADRSNRNWFPTTVEHERKLEIHKVNREI